MRFFIGLIAAIFLYAPAHAQNDQIQFGPPPEWVVPSPLIDVPNDASGLVYIRRQDSLVHFVERGQLHYLGYRYKLLHSNALQLGNLSIVWKPESGAPTVHAIKIHRDGTTIDALPDISFEILRREDQLELAMLDGFLTAIARIPDLRVGDELELSYTTPISDPTLGNSGAGILLLQSGPALGQIRLGLSWAEGEKPNIQLTDDMTDVAKRGVRAIDFSFENPESRTPPKDAPPRFNWQRLVEFSDFSEWEEISQRFSQYYRDAATLKVNSPLLKEAQQIAAAHDNDFNRANAALNLVQQNVRYIYVGLDTGNLVPATAEETWQRRYGDCKGKTALLLALLRALEIEAEPVMASNAGIDDGLDERLPNPGMFDHVLVRAKIDGKSYYLDGTLPAVVPPTTEPSYPYRWVLPINSQGASIEKLDWLPHREPNELRLFEIDARAGFGSPAKKTSIAITRGIKALEEQIQFSGLAPGQLLDVMRQSLIGDTWQEIDDVTWRFDEQAQASVLTIIGNGLVDWDNNGGGGKSLALPGGGFNPPSKRIRAAADSKSIPYYNKPGFSVAM
ncbi:MAG: DUF3857 domain-containing protein [Pseudomonadota bacterium]